MTNNEFRLIGDSLALCDVRCGPTEDKHIVQLAPDAYSVVVDDSGESVSISICRSDVAQPAQGAELGELLIDGAILGAYDAKLPTDIFGGNAEAFYEWGDSLFGNAKGLRVFRDSIAPYEFAHIPALIDGNFVIVELRDGDVRVGARLIASAPESPATATLLAFQFFLAADSMRVEVWLDPVYDDESILDSIADELGEALGREVDLVEVLQYIGGIESMEFAIQVDEDLGPSQLLELPDDRTTWLSDGGRFCDYLRRIMLERGAGIAH